MTITRAACIGGGVIGGGWIARLALNGIDVTVYDPHPEAKRKVDEVMKNARRAYKRMAVKGLPKEGKVTYAASIAEAVKDADFIQESVPERLDVKLKTLAEIEAAAPADALIGSSTSGFKATHMAKDMKHPERFLAAHYFQPAEVFPMVEVVAGEKTDQALLDRVAEAMKRTGKQPVVMRKPIVGFLINRLQHAVLHEAYWMVSQGACTVEDVDDVARQMLGPRMCITGLILQKDIGGLAIHAKAQQGIVPHLAHDSTPNPDVQAMIAAGGTGLAAGRGFYDWSACDAKAVRQQATGRLNALLDFLKGLTKTSAPKTDPVPRDIRTAR